MILALVLFIPCLHFGTVTVSSSLIASAELDPLLERVELLVRTLFSPEVATALAITEVIFEGNDPLNGASVAAARAK